MPAPAPAEVAPELRGTALERAAGVDVQRSATPLEKVLTALGTSNYISAGLADAATGGGNVLETVPRALKQHTTYGDLLRKHGVTNGWVAGGVGLALDIVLDPQTYTGFGAVTKAGRLAKSAEMASRIAALTRDADDIAHAARLAQAASRVSPFVEGMGKQAEAGHRALVSLLGRPVIQGAPVLGALEKVGAAMGGAGKVGAVARGAESLVQSEPELRGLDREVFKVMKARIGGQQKLAVQEVQKRMAAPVAQVMEASRKLGMEHESVMSALSDYIEGPLAAGWNPRNYMTPEEVVKYDRWRREATVTANAGTPRYSVDTGNPTLVYEGDRTAAGELVTTQTPHSGTLQGPAHIKGALDFRMDVGVAEDAIENYLPQNSYKALRRIEKAAAERARLNFVPSPELEPAFRAARSEHDALMAKWLGATKGAGISIEGLTGIDYLRHKIRPEAVDIIEKFGPDEFRGVGREITEKHGAQVQRALSGAFDADGNLVRLGADAEETATLARQTKRNLSWRPLTRNEANALAEKGELTITGYRPVKGGLFEDVGTATALRASEGARAVGGAELIKGYAETPGMAENLAALPAAQRHAREVELIRQGWRTVPNEIKGVGKDVMFRGDIGAALARRGEKILPPDNRTLRSIAKGYDEGLRAWKSWTLGVFPVFHTRNEIDDLFRAIGYGGMDFRRLGDAARVSAWGTRLWRGGPEPVFFAKGGARYTATELKNLMIKWGVVDTGQMSEVLNQLGALARPKGMLEHAADNRVVNAGKEFGRVRENWTRSALFLDGLKRGMSPGEAAARTAKYLFDYGDLSKVEQQFMRRLFPFYTYTRKNIPIQLENLVAKPGLAAGVEKARQESSQGEGLGLPGGISLNSKLRESLPMRVGRTKEGNPQFLRLAGQLGLSDLNSVMSPYGMVQKAEDLLTPALSTPIEIAKNYDTYRDAPMEDYPGQQTNLVGVPVSSRYGYPLLTNFRPLSELDRLLALKKDYAVPSTGERIANLVVGRTYAADPGALAARQAMATEREVRRLQMFLRRAKSPQEAQKIVKEIQRVIAHPERLK
jgi:hypothetical protein